MAFLKTQEEFNKTFGKKTVQQLAGMKARKAMKQANKDAKKARKKRESFLHTVARFKTKYIK